MTYLLAFLTALFITYFSVPSIINLALIKKLYDQPTDRKIHGHRIAALGGISIFAGFIFSFIFFTHNLYYPQLNSILAGTMILFALGIKDDLFPLTARKKILGQVAAVLIVVIQGNVRLESFYGLFGIHGLPYWFSVVFTFFFVLLLVNAINFIDGINGLAGGIGLFVVVVYACFFYVMGEELFFILCLSYAGALLGFLRYNLVKAHIFMGDSGSTVLGFLIAIITVYFIRTSVVYEPNIFFEISSAVFAFALLIIPVFDTLRVVFIRVFILRKSPFNADRNHIHHVLLDIGLTHLQATSVLVIANAGFVALAWWLNDVMLPKFQLLLYIGLALMLSQIPFLIKRKQKQTGTYKASKS